MDLDNAASIAAGENAGQKRTSSGYLPPEMATIEVFRRSGAVQYSTNTDKVEDLKAKLQAAFADNDFMKVTSLSKELSQISSSQTSAPLDVIASSKYDMWCFGALLYYLCTGIQLFNVDVREELVAEEDFVRLMEWDDDVKASKLDKIGAAFSGARSLTHNLLEKDPCKRPANWDFVLDKLNRIGKADCSQNNKEGTAVKTTGHVFVSYSRRNTDKMSEVYSHLEANDIPLWMDKELTPGTSIGPLQLKEHCLTRQS